MDSRRHFTTRRAFVGAMGFGALGLYGTRKTTESALELQIKLAERKKLVR